MLCWKMADENKALFAGRRWWVKAPPQRKTIFIRNPPSTAACLHSASFNTDCSLTEPPTQLQTRPSCNVPPDEGLLCTSVFACGPAGLATLCSPPPPLLLCLCLSVQQKQQLEKETGLKIVEAGVSDVSQALKPSVCWRASASGEAALHLQL